MSTVQVISEVGQWIVLVGCLALLLGTMSTVVSIKRRLGPEDLGYGGGLEVGAPAPEIAAADGRTGRPVSLASHAGAKAVVAFLSPTCRACNDVVTSINELVNGTARIPVIAVLAPGHGTLRKQLSRRVELVDDLGNTLKRAYAVGGFPAVYVVSPDGTIAGRSPVSGEADLRALLVAADNRDDNG